jgi:endo-1,4-beta-xylanase
LVAIRSPSVVYTGGKYHVFATVVNSAGSANMQHIQFADWANASSATVDFFDNYSGFTGSRSQPQVFYFTAKKTWYLITQSGAPAYSTNADLSQTAAWTKPATFFSGTPTVVTQNAGSGGIGWTDFWIICDGSTCYMFFTNQKGYLFRSQTTASNFPSGFGDPVVVMQSSYLVEGGRIYKVNGAGQFLMLIEGTGSGGRYIGAWSATALDGKWTALAETEANPFAGAANTTFSGTKWTKDVGHGELIRSTTDETMTVDNCNMRYLYAGRDPYTSATAALYPWKLGLLVRSK